MTHDLLHGDLAAAALDNAFLLIMVPLLAAGLLLKRRRGPGTSPTVSAALIGGIIGLAIGWALLRNLPGFPLVPITITN